MSLSLAGPKRPEITNFLRYPGSKRRLMDILGPLLPKAQHIHGRYVEPFVGGGAVFFYINPTKALLSDINPDLIELYRGLRLAPKSVWKRYCSFGNSKSEYCRIRDSERGRLLIDRAARVLFLNRTCFKGMWRHNRQGDFNVGYGGQARRWVITQESLIAVGRALRKAILACSDFEEVIDTCEGGDFLFLDPPYRPGETELRHGHYLSQRFCIADHQRLSSALRRAKRRGVQWALTTSSHPDIVALFKGNKIMAMPRGVSERPGIIVANSGEVFITSHSISRTRP